MRYATLSILSLYIFILAPGLGHADTIQVPADQATIQAAIDTAASGDLILVAAGTYMDNLDFLGKAITVRSVSGAAATVIDGGASVDPVYTSVATFRNGEGLDSVLDGFTLTNGTGYREDWGLDYVEYGGGIFCDSASPTITNCIITENLVDSGGGIWCQNGAAPLIEDNVITNNTGNGGGIGCISASSPTIRGNHIESNHGYTAGGGISCRDGSSPLIENNYIGDNSSQWFAGGISCWSDCSPTLSRNIISGNRVDIGLGGGIYCTDHSSPIIDRCVVSFNWTQGGFSGLFANENSSPQISNCLFNNNTSWISDGGALGFGRGNPSLTNCTVAENFASFQGGAIYCGSDVNLTIVNCIFWENEAANLGKEIFIYYDAGAPSHVTINHSDLQGGLSSVHVETGSSLDWGSEMIDEDPRFVDAPNGDFHLTGRSPCVNRGDDAAAPAEDIEGDLRPYMGAVDMGADEFLGLHPLESSAFTLSVTGGMVDFTLQAGPENAGRYYLILGSKNGHAPGIPLPGGSATLPLNWDGFTDSVLARVNSGLFQNFLGILDGAGVGAASINAPAVHPSKIGQVMHFAYLLEGTPLWDYAANPVPVEFVP